MSDEGLNLTSNINEVVNTRRQASVFFFLHFLAKNWVKGFEFLMQGKCRPRFFL